MDAKLIKHRLQLEKMKKDLVDQLEFAEGLQKHVGLRDSTQELSMIDNHPADLGSENYERAKDISLHEKNQLILKKVDEALEKLAVGAYGICENCGKHIPDERLDAVPYAEFCLHCKKKSEGAPHDYPRPIEEKVLRPSYTRSSAGYDGEDAWQDVANYNKLPNVFYEETVDEDDEKTRAVEDTDRISNEEYENQLPD